MHYQYTVHLLKKYIKSHLGSLSLSRLPRTFHKLLITMGRIRESSCQLLIVHRVILRKMHYLAE